MSVCIASLNAHSLGVCAARADGTGLPGSLELQRCYRSLRGVRPLAVDGRQPFKSFGCDRVSEFYCDTLMRR